MRISDWSSDVCSSDLKTDARLSSQVRPHPRCQDARAGRRASSRQGAQRDDRGSGGLSAACQTTAGARAHRRQHRRRARRLSARHYRTGGRSEEHTSELQSLMRISYAVFCLKKKKKTTNKKHMISENTQKT